MSTEQILEVLATPEAQSILRALVRDEIARMQAEREDELRELAEAMSGALLSVPAGIVLMDIREGKGGPR